MKPLPRDAASPPPPPPPGGPAAAGSELSAQRGRTGDDEVSLRALEEGIDPVRGLYGPGSLTWHVLGDAALHLAGLRALLLQVAHPKVAAGVATYSDFRGRPLDRARRTFEAVYAIFFGGRDEAVRAARRVRGVHTRIRGRLDATAPGDPHPGFRADDPALLLWVYATLIDGTMFAYDTFLGPLGEAQWRSFYVAGAPAAELLGIPRRYFPADLTAFRAYFDAALEDALEVGPAAREIAGALFSVPPFPRVLGWPAHVLAAGTLPPRIREAYGLPWGVTTRAAYRTGVEAARAVLRSLPPGVRTVPAARNGERRCRGLSPAGGDERKKSSGGGGRKRGLPA
jgi:uncharacterized protein (DUF2236 family)